jgi:hypothetical protein
MKKTMICLSMLFAGSASAQIDIRIPEWIDGTLAPATLPAAQCPAGYLSGSFTPLPVTNAAGPTSMRMIDYSNAYSAAPIAGFCRAGRAFTFSAAIPFGGGTQTLPNPVCGSVYFIEQSVGELHCRLRSDTAAENLLLASKLSAAQAQVDSMSKQVSAAEQRDAALQKSIDALRACMKDKAACKNL